MTAEDQALNSRSTEAEVFHTRQSPRYRLCKDAPETVQHFTAGCKMLTGKAHMQRHNQVAGIHRNIWAKYELGPDGPMIKMGDTSKGV